MKITELAWSAAAYLASRPAICNWLIRRAKRRPYSNILGPDGSVYMERYWLFNPFPSPGGPDKRHFPFSIQLHRIMVPDQDRHQHDHPWNFRTLIMRGSYVEERGDEVFFRRQGSTASINFGQYHRVASVTVNGCWTMFITGAYQGSWGFLVDGAKVHYRKYLGLDT